MKLSRITAAIAVSLSVALPAIAEDEGAIPPARAGEMADFSKAEKMAYVAGVIQALAYLTATTSEDYNKAACIAGQEKLAYRTLSDASPDDLVALEIELAIMETCDAGSSNGTGTLLGAGDVDEWFGSSTPQLERALFVYGLSDTVFFRVFSRVEDSVAECVHELSQVAMSPDNDFSRQFESEPSEPLVADLIDRPVGACLE
ncbi:hypothetical protein WNY37_06520 [Henriciella sp. AS95]|uniref:hypothetical protein n=1 Tax=Henriciella sp. AS95 TaxID=3135782 RepID=UPI00317851A1